MKVWPLEERPLGKGSIVVFQSEVFVEKKHNIVLTSHIVSTELALREVNKYVRRGTVVLTDQETGERVGFELDGRERLMYPHFRTPQMERVTIEQFPWEVLNTSTENDPETLK